MTQMLAGKRILVVEDEYIIARDLAGFLELRGAVIVGPAATVRAALALVDKGQLDGAVLDINLHREPIYPVADTLIDRGVPIVFATGYDELLVDRRYIGMPRCQKPIDKEALLKTLAAALTAARS